MTRCHACPWQVLLICVAMRGTNGSVVGVADWFVQHFRRYHQIDRGPGEGLVRVIHRRHRDPFRQLHTRPQRFQWMSFRTRDQRIYNRSRCSAIHPALRRPSHLTLPFVVRLIHWKRGEASPCSVLLTITFFFNLQNVGMIKLPGGAGRWRLQAGRFGLSVCGLI